MKNLALLILFAMPLMAIGQITIFPDNRVLKPKPRILTVETVLDYQKECYNDSTVEYNYMIEYWDGMKIDTIYSKTILMLPESFINQIKTYVHKTPTFEGFLQYLEKIKP